MGHSTRKERDKTALRLALDYLEGEGQEYRFGQLGQEQIIHAIRYALIGGPAPPWWAELLYEQRAINREYREEERDHAELSE